MAHTPTSALGVEIRAVKAQPYLAKRVRAPLATVGESVRNGFAALYHRLQETGCTPSGAPFLLADYPKDGYLEMELGAPCDSPPADGQEFHAACLPEGREAVVVHRGSYEGIGELYPALREWIAASRLTMSGPPREVYLSPPGEEPVTELVWPVK